MSDEQFSLRNFVGNLLSLAQRPPPNGVWAEAVSQFSGIDHVAVTENNNASRSNVSGTSSSPSANADVQPIANAMSACMWEILCAWNQQNGRCSRESTCFSSCIF